MFVPTYDEVSNYAENKAFVATRMGTDAYLVEKETYEAQDILREMIAGMIRLIVDSGCLQIGEIVSEIDEDDLNIDGKVRVSNSYNNKFQLNAMDVMINGYKSHISGSGTVGVRPNMITLPEPPGADTRNDLVMLEVWEQIVSKDDPIYKYGGVNSGALTNDLLDPRAGGLETSRRIQRRWRIKTYPDINFTTYPNGVDDPTVFAQGGAEVDKNYSFSLTENDPFLYRAGDGSVGAKSALATVDGYVYAIPLFKVARNTSTTIEVADITDLRHKIHISLKGVTGIGLGENQLVKRGPNGQIYVNTEDADGLVYHGGNMNAGTGITLTKTGAGIQITATGGVAPAEHAVEHATGGSDPVSPESIGAETPTGAQNKVDAHADVTNAHSATSAATANRLMLRDSNGRAKVASPSAADDIARKDTVDTHANLTNPHSATSAATANRLMLRDSNGRAKVSAPSAADDIARKDTVDAVNTALTSHVGSGGESHAVVVANGAAGFMSGSDKAKLNNLKVNSSGYALVAP